MLSGVLPSNRPSGPVTSARGGTLSIDRCATGGIARGCAAPAVVAALPDSAPEDRGPRSATADPTLDPAVDPAVEDAVDPVDVVSDEPPALAACAPDPRSTTSPPPAALPDPVARLVRPGRATSRPPTMPSSTAIANTTGHTRRGGRDE